MKLALIGATGNIGQATLNEALQRGYEVTAIVRDPQKLNIKNDKLTIAVADVFNIENLAAVLAGHDAVINSYNASWTTLTCMTIL